jgi:hypothetical protein
VDIRYAGRLRRCGANASTLLEVKRTLRVGQEHVDLAPLTHSGQQPGRNPAAQQVL